MNSLKMSNKIVDLRVHNADKSIPEPNRSISYERFTKEQL